MDIVTSRSKLSCALSAVENKQTNQPTQNTITHRGKWIATITKKKKKSLLRLIKIKRLPIVFQFCFII